MFTTKLKIAFFTLLFGFNLQVQAQFTVGFEDVSLNAQGYFNGSDLSGSYQSSGLRFLTDYNAQFQAWSGFGASSVTDSATPGYANQYGCYAGSGADGSEKFCLGYVFAPPTIRNEFIDVSRPKLLSFRFTNNTYAGLSMKNGDAVAKKFGGVTGNDPDFFKLLVYNYLDGIVTDTGEVYLADFRSADNSQDFIVKAWRTATFNFSSRFDSLVFDLESSDNGTFGMNTPAYFCLDNLQLDFETGIEGSVLPKISMYPNPAQNELIIRGLNENSAISITDLVGRKVEVNSTTTSGGLKLEVSSLPIGVYQIRSNNRSLGKFVKN